MAAFLLRRLVLTIPVVWIVVTLVFALIHIVPGDPVAQMLGEGAPQPEIQKLRHELGLDRPLLEQYRVVCFRSAEGRSRNFLSESGIRSAGYCVALSGDACNLRLRRFVVSLVFAIPAGVISAVKRGTLIDRRSVFSACLEFRCRTLRWALC